MKQIKRIARAFLGFAAGTLSGLMAAFVYQVWTGNLVSGEKLILPLIIVTILFGIQLGMFIPSRSYNQGYDAGYGDGYEDGLEDGSIEVHPVRIEVTHAPLPADTAPKAKKS